MKSSFKELSLVEEELREKLFLFESNFFLWPWKKEDWLSPSSHLYLLVIFEEELAGFSILEKNPWDETAHLLKILVHPKLLRKKIGSQMLSLAEEELKGLGATSIYLEVESQNKRAISFYESSGFGILTLKKKFYTDGRDAYSMQKKLNILA